MSAVYFRPAVRTVGAAIGYSLWTLLAGFALPGLFIFVAVRLLAMAGLVEQTGLAQPPVILGLFAAQYSIGLLLLVAWPLLICRQTPSQLRAVLGLTRRPALSDAAWAAGAFLLYVVAATAVLALAKDIFPLLDVSQQQNVGFSGLTDIVGLIAAFVALIIMAPVAEELIFRGYLLGNLGRLVGSLAAAFITSALFGLVHGQWNVGIDVAVLSLFLCMLRLKTGSIWASIFLHMLKNSLAFFALFVAPLLGIRIQ